MNDQEQPVQLNGEGMKREGETMNLDQLLWQLHENYGGTSEVTYGIDEDGNDNGARVIKYTVDREILTGTSYYLMIPALKWRRKTELNGQNGEVIKVLPQEDLNSFQISEVSVLMLQPTRGNGDIENEQSLAEKNILHNLDPKTGTNGPEVEFSIGSLLNGDDLEEISLGVLQKWMIELLRNQRETSPVDPLNNSIEVVEFFKEVVYEALIELEGNGLLLNMAGTAAEIELGEKSPSSLKAGDPSKYAPYVDFLSHRLAEEMLANVDKIPNHTRSAWEKIAVNNGYSDLKSMLTEINDLKHWLMSAGHDSTNVEGDNVTGFASERVLVNNSNLLIYFRDFVDGLTDSGSHTYNTDIKIEDSDISDARRLLRFVMPTAQPADPIKPGESLHANILRRLLKGDAIHPDRLGLVTLLDGVELPNTHGDIRIRVSIGLEKFYAILEDNKNENEEPAKEHTKSLRSESTGRSITPDSRKYKYSLDLQDVIFKAANFAVIDGYEDVYQWLEEKVGLENLSPADEYTRTLQDRLDEQYMSLTGELNMDKLNHLEKVVNYIHNRIADEHKKNFDATDGAVKGIKALRGINTMKNVLPTLSSGSEKMAWYMNSDLANWGTFENLLNDDDIIDILSSKHFYAPSDAMWVVAQMLPDQNNRVVQELIIRQRLNLPEEYEFSKGKLIAMLRHRFTKFHLFPQW
jgi:hypothetical protein